MIFKQFKFRIVYNSPQGWKTSPAKVLTFNGTGVVSGEAEDGADGPIDWETAFLVQFAGAFDKAGMEIYHADILEDEAGKRFEVIAVGSGYGIVAEDETFLYLTDDVARKLTIVSSAITDEDTSAPANAEEVFAAAAKPKKVYTLKKPTT